MKKFLFIVLIVLFVLALIACGKSPEEKLAEDILEQNGVDADVDMDGDDVDLHMEQDGATIDIEGDGDSGSMTISDGEDEIVMDFDDNTAWPADKMPGHVPQIQGVQFVGTQVMGPAVSVYFEGCNESVAASYVSALEANGWEIVMTIDSEGAHNIQAQNGDEEWLQFTWTEEDGSGGVVYSTNE